MAILTTIPVSANNANMNNVRNFSQLSSTKETGESTSSQSASDEQISVQSNDDSGMIYDFKDSKTSGVVTATKTWEDNLSNNEREMPDISISTLKPSKNPLGYTITYHGNGLTFADESTENQIIVNSSGKIVSGQYEELLASSGWYSDSSCVNKIELNSDGLPVSGITSDLNLYAKPKTFVLKGYDSFENYNEFCSLIPSATTSVVFTDEVMPASATLIDVDADGDDGVVAWIDGTVMKVSTQTKGLKVQTNPDSSYMFYSKRNLKKIDLSILDTRNVTSMSYMFCGCNGLTALDLTPLDTRNVTSMSGMFSNCNKLDTLDLTPLDTRNVTNMGYVFADCSGLTSLNLSPLDTRNVTDMRNMYKKVTEIKSHKLIFDTFFVPEIKHRKI